MKCLLELKSTVYPTFHPYLLLIMSSKNGNTSISKPTRPGDILAIFFCIISSSSYSRATRTPHSTPNVVLQLSRTARVAQYGDRPFGPYLPMPAMMPHLH